MLSPDIKHPKRDASSLLILWWILNSDADKDRIPIKSQTVSPAQRKRELLRTDPVEFAQRAPSMQKACSQAGC